MDNKEIADKIQSAFEEVRYPIAPDDFKLVMDRLHIPSFLRGVAENSHIVKSMSVLYQSDVAVKEYVDTVIYNIITSCGYLTLRAYVLHVSVLPWYESVVADTMYELTVDAVEMDKNLGETLLKEPVLLITLLFLREKMLTNVE